MRNILNKPKSSLPDVGYAVLMLIAMACTMLVSEEARADISDCTMTLSPAEHNYGELLKSRQNFVSTAQGNATELSQRTSNLTVTCPQAERMDLRFTGASLADGTFAFGAKGKVNIVLASAVLDGNAVQLSKTKHKGVVIGPMVADSQTISADDEITVGSNSSVKGKSLNAVVTVNPYLLQSAFVVSDAYVQEELLNIELLAVN
ncbi:DUF1120 domain-containing protein [Ewingella americana]|uniref:hypothetical protein n=1 Tax=Ewingella americana TaxID=41202 RepID=UPI0012ADC4F2|nr:hypothetical protein [Ewingella americana]MRT03209.1 hypothetical protein [Ewingella americana]